MDNKKEQLRAAITLITRLPPSKMNKNQVGLISLAPAIEDNLLESIDLPHSTVTANFSHLEGSNNRRTVHLHRV